MYLTGEQHDHRSGRGGRTGVWPGVADGTGGCFYWAHSWTWVCWGWGWSVAKAAGIWQSLGDLQQQPHYFGLGLRWAALKSKRKEFQDVFFRPKRDMIDSKYILFLQQICVVKIDIFIRSLHNWGFRTEFADFATGSCGCATLTYRSLCGLKVNSASCAINIFVQLHPKNLCDRPLRWVHGML